MHAISAAFFGTLVVTCVSGYPNLWNINQLSPVHGLYVKRSSDGSTGDLFVAATEENGVKSQWAVDQPINFLPVAATAQPQAAAISVAYPASYTTANDESATQKRAVMPSAPVQYAYAMPVQSGAATENGQVASYPYAYTIPTATTETSATKCEHQASVPQYPYQFPFQMFYPQMMSAYTNAKSILKDAGLSEDSANTVMGQAAPTWAPASYAYPMYVMVDPSAWAQNQAATTTTSTPASPAASTQSEESNS
uniref:VMP25 protein n=1 Tax=Heliothis virescens TaxID=7102 RepID=A0A2A4K1W2_HELVI